MPERVYLAGPMTGIPAMNFPAFDAAAQRLRDWGYDVVSPAELDDPADRAAALASPDGHVADYAEGKSWGDFLARDVKLIADEGIEAIVVLPGWEKSKGARLETFVGRLAGVPILAYCPEPGSYHVELPELHPDFFNIAHGAPRACEPLPLGSVRALPAGEVRVVNAKTGGEKGSKPQALSLLPTEALLAISEVYHFGAAKYKPNNWRLGYEWHLSTDALLRHVLAFNAGDDLDPESGLPHLAHAGFHIFTLLTFLLDPEHYGGELDTRWKGAA